MLIRYVGLDVHKDSIKIAVAEEGREPARILASIPGENGKLIRQISKLGPSRSVRCCYEAGPGGYTVYRALTAAGIDCKIIAPSMIPKQSGKRVKTDRLDAENLAHYLRSGDLTEVWVPDEVTESIRNLVRLREDARIARLKARQQLNQFLLRKGHVYPRKTHWVATHMEWIRSQKFTEEADNVTLSDYLRQVQLLDERVANVGEDLKFHSKHWKQNGLVEYLQGLRGIAFISAVAIAAEAGDLRRFSTAGKFMSYVGLVPSEHSSGQREKRGSITRCGNVTVRRLLVEAAWHYRHKPSKSRAITLRNEKLPKKVQDIAWKAQERLHRKYMKLLMSGKPKNKVCVAVARELAGFIWAIGQSI
ncbi:MAG: IS110 family transposase [Candidatus Fermentibacteraceae bacterium]|nr:IS110 family transposase [Candidatus Fermentibacteraceae bacterium]